MRIIKKELFSAGTLLLTALCITPSYAEEPIDCATGTCAPCGLVSANVANTPSYGTCAVNPLMNYVATSEIDRCRGYYSGFYLGGGFGLGVVNYKLEVGGVTPASLDSNTRSYLVALVNGGFNLVLDCFFLGGEVGYNYRSRTNSVSYFDDVDFALTTGVVIDQFAQSFPCKVRIDINSQHAVTADILPGFVYDRFVGYLRLGVERSNYTWDRRVCFPAVTLENVDVLQVTVNDTDFIDSQSKSTHGYRLGAGFGIAASRHVSFHLNYIHTFGSKLTFTPNTAELAAITPILIVSDETVSTVNISQLAANNVIEPERDEVNLTVKFRF